MANTERETPNAECLLHGRRLMLCYMVPATALVPFFSRKHPHETEHVIVDEVGLDSTDHEIPSRLREEQHFDAVLGRHRRPLQQGLPARILSPVYTSVRIVDQRHTRRSSG